MEVGNESNVYINSNKLTEGDGSNVNLVFSLFSFATNPFSYSFSMRYLNVKIK